METAANANDFENSVDVVDHIPHQHHDQDQDPVPVPDASNSSHGDHETESKPEFNEEEMRGVLEVIAATGKFWHDWDRLKSMLSFQLKQILLAARSIYPNLSKLALALEKNLLVTSTLTACTDPYPQAMTQAPEEPEKTSEEPQLHSHSVQNGVEPMVGDRDEVMTEVEQADIDDEMTIDMEALDEIVGSSETNSTPTGNS